MPGASGCPHCGNPIPEASRYCGSCGQPVEPSSALPTVNLPSRAPLPSGNARFLPGAILAGRYRIMGLLGRGGMGEVYRADDLKLGQPVALKFLPAEFERDPDRLQRFLAEVSTARQVSHANVCRIHDAGEAEGHHFLSMEYVDGEDLASLLRRIGHLPREKAIQIARQICAGLAASHDAGVLHRDLKPANVMIDGRGRARITDFGLAGFTERIAGEEILSGTPAYMAPEQLEGREVSVRSDIYALGLVLYELFTGKQAFQARSVAERRRLPSATPSAPSSLMEGFDPIVERVILRCLEADPGRRPSSALVVAAALPGGDPIAAALAAGETPSPEMVAEAGNDAVVPALSWGALALFAVALAGAVVLTPRTTLLGMVTLEKPPEFLRERAREILAEAGYPEKPADSLFAFEANQDLLDEARRRPGAHVGPDGIRFWYRQSPEALTPFAGATIGQRLIDPPNDVPGMARVGLHPDGRLVSFLVVPGERTAVSAEPDWQPLIRASGLEVAALTPAASEWAPTVYADRRVAWTGTRPGGADRPVRIEAASAGGRPVSFRIIESWTRPAEQPKPPEGFWRRAALLLNTLGFISVVIAAGIVAWRNVRRGRGDRRGALRFALYLGAIRMLWYLAAHHVPSTEELEVFVGHLSYSMQRVGLAYVFYLALEPYARRIWPHMLVSWVRVLDGRFRDPLVGRDLLVGSAVGAAFVVISRLAHWLPTVTGGTPPLPTWSVWTFDALRGPVPSVVAVLGVHTLELLDIIFPMTLILVFRLFLRNTAAAVAALTLVAAVMFLPESGSLPMYLLEFAFRAAVAWVILFRFGLLAFATSFNVAGLLRDLPLTLHPEGWYLGATLLSLAVVVAPALWGFWTSRSGRALFRDALLEPEARRP